MGHYYGHFFRRWTFAVTLTLKVAIQSFHVTFWLMIIHDHIMLVANCWTVQRLTSGQKFKMNNWRMWFNIMPPKKTSNLTRKWGGGSSKSSCKELVWDHQNCCLWNHKGNWDHRLYNYVGWGLEQVLWVDGKVHGCLGVFHLKASMAG